MFVQLQSCHSPCKVCPGSKIVSRRSLRQWLHMIQKSQTLSKPLTALPSWKRMQRQSPGGSTSARSWNILGHSDGSTRCGPMVQGHLMTMETQDVDLIRFQSPEDEKARSAVPLRFPCEQYHKGITKWIDNLWDESNMSAHNKLVRIHCKAGSLSVRLVFENKSQVAGLLWPDIKMMVSLLRSPSPASSSNMGSSYGSLQDLGTYLDIVMAPQHWVP